MNRHAAIDPCGLGHGVECGCTRCDQGRQQAAEIAQGRCAQTPKGGHPGYVWVCGACGKHTAPGESAMALRDASCYCWAVLCYPQSAEEKAERRWRAADGEEDLA